MASPASASRGEAQRAEQARSQSQTATVGNTDRLCRPGFGLPLTWMPRANGLYGYSRTPLHFPVLFRPRDPQGYLGDPTGWAAATLLIREVCMLKLIDDLTNKPEWWHKIYDPSICAKWKSEAMAMDWKLYRPHADFTPNMVDACFAEIRKKAELYQKTSLIPVFDYSLCVIKSDKLISDELRKKLNNAVKALEDVPDDKKDWHPGSGRKVLDLVHPSLYPLVYGRSRVLPDRQISVHDCLTTCGLGEVIPEPDAEEKNMTKGTTVTFDEFDVFSAKFQWLPCDISLDAEGNPTIESYINNLHPNHHSELYPIIQQFIKASLPAWDLIYRWPKSFPFQRLSVKSVETSCFAQEACGGLCQPTNRPLNEGEGLREHPTDSQHEDTEWQKLDSEWFDATHKTILPDPSPGPDLPMTVSASDVKTSGFFDQARRIQVIVKLATISLTPESPTYDGGSWHIEGQLNEHICATALFYYSSQNITSSRLAFRTPSNREDLMMELDYEQDDYLSINNTFAVNTESANAGTLQDIGSVVTQEGRAVFFPNVFQHRVEPFELKDKTQQGHRKIMALFLVDPAIPILSTANVPPQQSQWWPAKEYVRNGSKLPLELRKMVLDNMDYIMENGEAQVLRDELMAGRTVMQTTATDRVLPSVQFNFCEH